MAYREFICSSSSSDEEKDNEDEVCWKRRKSMSQTESVDFSNALSEKRVRRVRNNIWKNVINEHKLDEALSAAHMHKKCDTTRDVESYLVFSELDNEVPQRNKNEITQPVSKQKGLSLRQQLGPMQWDSTISRSHISVDFNSPSNVSETIINLLKEQNTDLIKKAVDVLGVQRALEFYYLTEDIERGGGLYLTDGSRRRSPGGVYLNLIKHSYDVTNEERKAIFLTDKKAKDKLKRLRRQARHIDQKNMKLVTESSTGTKSILDNSSYPDSCDEILVDEAPITDCRESESVSNEEPNHQIY